MASIEVDAAALSMLARRCKQQAWRLEGFTVPPPPGEETQPSAVAISAAYADIAAACVRFATRMNDTAAALSTAAWGYAATEDAATNALTTVAA